MIKPVWRNFDFLLLLTTVLLLALGIVLIYSATISTEGDTVLSERLFFRQATYAAGGLFILLLASVVDYQLLGLMSWVVYALAIAALALVAVVGQQGFGAQSWLNLRRGIQPSELSKILLIVFLAKFLGDRHEQRGDLRLLLYSAALLIPPVFLIYRQPDMGTALVVLAIWLGMIFAAGARLVHLGLLGLAMGAAVPLVWFSMKDYMRERVLTFVNQLTSPTGAASVADYNTRQALTSIGSGGLFGKGFLHGTQSQLYFLRVRHTDYVFSVLSEELGFVGSVAVLLLFVILLWRILHTATLARDHFGQLIACGVATMIFFQAVVNIGVNVGLLPVTGLTLPLVSYGGSSVWATLLAIGLVENVALRHKTLEFGD
jgi:rod shape determining protein RodA